MSEEKLVREFPLEFAQVGDGRTVDVRVVPYGREATVSDHGGEPYRETWLHGVFSRATRAANRVWLNFEHEQGLRGVVGHGVELVERDDGLYGSFRVLDGPDGDKALQMVNDKLLPGVSLEAVALRSNRRPDGVVERVKAVLKAVALCRFPAFEEAVVLAVREGEPDPDEPEPQPEPPRDEEPVARSEVDEILGRMGWEPLLKRAVTSKPWDGSASRFTDEQWARSCLLDRGDQFDTAKTRYALPVLEPNGDLNVNGMHAAAARLNQVNATSEQKAAAARKLRRYYGMAGEEMPASMMAMAGRA